MKYITTIKNHLGKHKMQYIFFITSAVLCCLSMHLFAADPASGTDILATSGLDKTVQASTGVHSTLFKVLLSMALVLDFVAYLRSKNPLVLVAGVPLIIAAAYGLSALITSV